RSSIERTVPTISSTIALASASDQIGRVAASISPAVPRATPANRSMFLATTRIATRSAATIATTTTARAYPSVHHKRKSASSMAPAPRRLRFFRSRGRLLAQKAVFLVEVMHEADPRAGPGDVPPAAGHVVLVVPAGFHVHEVLGDSPQRPQEGALEAREGRRDVRAGGLGVERREAVGEDRKSTRLNSSH